MTFYLLAVRGIRGGGGQQDSYGERDIERFPSYGYWRVRRGVCTVYPHLTRGDWEEGSVSQKGKSHVCSFVFWGHRPCQEPCSVYKSFINKFLCLVGTGKL